MQNSVLLAAGHPQSTSSESRTFVLERDSGQQPIKKRLPQIRIVGLKIPDQKPCSQLQNQISVSRPDSKAVIVSKELRFQQQTEIDQEPTAKSEIPVNVPSQAKPKFNNTSCSLGREQGRELNQHSQSDLDPVKLPPAKRKFADKLSQADLGSTVLRSASDSLDDAQDTKNAHEYGENAESQSGRRSSREHIPPKEINKASQQRLKSQSQMSARKLDQEVHIRSKIIKNRGVEGSSVERSDHPRCESLGQSAHSRQGDGNNRKAGESETETDT